MSMLGSDFEGVYNEEFESLRSFRLGKGSATEFLIEVPGDDEDWEQEMPEDLFNLLQYAERRSCSWVFLGSERLVNEELPTFLALALLPGEGLGLLENWLGCALPESQQEGGLSVGAVGPQGASRWRDYPPRNVRARSFVP